MSTLADRIDALLPQTQCTKCGYPSCRRYAEAVAAGEADFNRCPPAGAAGVRELAALLGRDAKPLDPANGAEQDRRVAVIDEARCIGCTLCIQACPVDAIVGAAKLMHTVVTELCTGCDLCVPPCPVDCIEMVPAKDTAWDRPRAEAARSRYERREARLACEREERALRVTRAGPQPEKKRAVIAQAIARARAKRAASQGRR
jgi:electron transport complex protein RnfB